MKRLVVSLLFILSFTLYAQQQPVLKNRRGINILPQQGEYCLGLSTNPFFTYFGNMFNNSPSNNAPGTAFATPNQMIFAKYMKTNELAYRASFRIGVNNNNLTYNVMDLSPGAPANAMVSDIQKQRNTVFAVSVGLEKRRGSTRLQGYYGGECFIMYNSGTNFKFNYGNKLEYLDTGSSRVTKIKSSSTFSVGIRAFVGVEYFIAPKISLGAELGYGPSFNFRSSSQQTTEQYDFSTGTAVTTDAALSPKSTGFSLDTDNYNGIIKLLFYF